MASNLPRREVSEEENLLIEAVSLLVQRQRDTEARTAAAERHFAELESRLADIEARLSEVAPSRVSGSVDKRLALLREQLEALRAESEGRGARPVGLTSLEGRRQPGSPSPHPSAAPPSDTMVPRASANEAAAATPPVRAPLEHRAAQAAAGGAVSAWDVFGATPRHRFALLLIVVGVLAVLYSAFLLIRFG